MSTHIAYAADPVTMQVGSPLALTAKPLAVQHKMGRWFPVGITLSNTGAQVQGRLELRLSASGGQADRSAVFYSDVTLPAQQSNKRVWLYGRSDNMYLDAATVTFSGRGFKTLKTTFQLAGTDLGQRLVLTVSDSDEKLSYLAGLRDKRLANSADLKIAQASIGGVAPQNSGAGYLRPVGSTRDLVPDRWFGLEAADAIVLHDFPHTALRPEQIAALRGYVAGGGTLVVPGGANWQRLKQSPLAEMWPMQPNSSSPAGSNQTSAIVARYMANKSGLSGADRLGGAPVLLLRGSVRNDARILLESSGVPLITIRDIGAGRVLMTAFDATQPPFIGWNGLPSLWVDVFRTSTNALRLEAVNRAAMPNFGNPRGYYNYNYAYDYQNTDPGSQMISAIRRLPQLQTPPTSTIAWFLALYVFCLVPLNYFVLRLFDRRELAWVSVPIIAIVFSVMAYMAARNIKGTTLLTRHVNIVQSGGGGMARADSLLWLFSPRRTSYTISSSNAQMAATDYINENNNDDGSTQESTSLTVFQPDASRPLRVEDASVKMWSEAKFVGQSLVETKGGAIVVPTGSGFSVQNNTPFDWRGVVLVTGGKVRAYGDLKAGATSANGRPDGINLHDPQLLGRIQNASDVVKLFSSTTQANNQSTMDSTMRDVANAALRAALGPDFGRGEKQALLIAWSKDPVAALTLENEASRNENVTLWVFRLNPNLANR